MIPNVIVLDPIVAEIGANIHEKFIVVHPNQKDKLLEGLQLMFPGREFIITTPEELEEKGIDQINKTIKE